MWESSTVDKNSISLSDVERELLDSEAARTGHPLSARVGVAIQNAFGSSQSVEEDLNILRQSFGAWGSQGDDGASYVEQLRSIDRINLNARF